MNRSSTYILTICMLILAVCGHAATDTLIPFASTWSYLDNGSNQGTAWQNAIQGGWATGPAQLGYGDGDEATNVFCGPSSPACDANNYITTYFQKTFNCANPAIYVAGIIRAVRDDGIVVYLNGTEIFRDNMPVGAPGYLTAASGPVGNENAVIAGAFNPALLLTGTNILSAEIHQSGTSSSDISFDLELEASTTATDTFIPLGATWSYLDNGSNQGTAWQNAIQGGWVTGPAQLGYGDGDEATNVYCGPSSPACNANNYITTYFQKTFNCINPAVYVGGIIRAVRDDGIVVYLNGIEIFRDNMPAGAPGYLTQASGAVGNETAIISGSFDPALLLAGTNILSAEIHQNLATSSDISFDLELSASTDVSITRGPYLQKGSTDRVTVRWRTDVAANSRVQFGAAPGNLTSIVDDPAMVTEHLVELTSLSAATTYYYSIGTTAGVLAGDDSNHFFVTHPPIGTDQPLRIWVLGDSGTANSNAAAVRNAYETFTGATHTDLWLMLGDNAYNTGLDIEYQAAVFDMYPAMLRKSVLWPTLGNHDAVNADSPGESGVYYNIFTLPRAGEAGGIASGTEAYYSFDFANVHFICLDSEDTPDRTVGGLMLTWLQNDIAATSQDWIIAFFHHPPYTKGSHDSDNPGDSLGRMQDMRQNALPILEAGGVDLVLTGHSHSYERSYLLDGHYGLSGTLVPAMILDGGDGRQAGDGAYTKSGPGPVANQGAVYAVAGSSGQISGGSLDHPAMFISLNTLGSMVLDIDDQRMDAIFLSSTGSQDDSFTLIKVTPTPTPTPAPTPTPTPAPTSTPAPTATPTATPIPTSNATRNWALYN